MYLLNLNFYIIKTLHHLLKLFPGCTLSYIYIYTLVYGYICTVPHFKEAQSSNRTMNIGREEDVVILQCSERLGYILSWATLEKQTNMKR